MNKKVVAVLSLLVFAAMFAACGDQKKDTGLDALNQRLAKLVVDSYGVGSTVVRGKTWTKLNAAKDELIAVAGLLPANAKIKVKGHACDIGAGSTAGDAANQRISTARAERVMAMLKTWGIAESKLASEGVSNTEKVEGANGKAPEQRRVSFVAVQE